MEPIVSSSVTTTRNLIARVVVGSRLHGLSTLDSDTDVAEVYMSAPHILFSPFHTDRGAIQINESTSQFELRHLLYLCSKGNPTALEILWSSLSLYDTWTWAEVRGHCNKFLTKDAVYHAHRGYALSQDKLKEGDNERRQIKARIAQYRILRQGIDLLGAGDFQPELPRSHQDILLPYKNGDRSQEKNIDSDIEALGYVLDDSFKNSILAESFDRDWFDAFLFDIYTRG